jgi:hypothetical protein
MDIQVAEQFAVPTGKTKALAQFNKITGALVGILVWTDPETLNNDYFVYKEIEIDFETEMVVGKADDFEVVAIASLPQVIYEEQLDLAAQQKITKEYTVVRQINVLGRAIVALSEKAGVEQEELLEMLDYIAEVKRENTLRKEFYRTSPDFIYKSAEDVAREEEERLEGGLHEAYGGRPIVGGSVF